jgi:nucleoside phosphorylase
MEAGPVKQLMSEPKDQPCNSIRGRIGANDVALFVTGIGPKKARSSAQAALTAGEATESGSPANRPDAVLIIGTCGSLSNSVIENEVIIYRECLATNETAGRVLCTASLADHLKTLLGTKGIKARSEVGISSPRIAATKGEKLALAKSGAEVVDMESYEIISAARQAQLPVAVIRVVSDSLDREIPDLNAALLDNGDFDASKAFKVAVASPFATAKVFAASRKAVKKLGEALEIVLSDAAFDSFHSVDASR